MNVLTLASKDPLGHNYDYSILSYNGWAILTNHIVIMGLVTVFMLWWLPRVGRSVKTGTTGTSHDYVTKGKSSHMVEVVCDFFRNDVARPALGKYTDRYLPFIYTLFFFILLNNLLGMVPILDATFLAHKAFTSGDNAAHQVEAGTSAVPEEGMEDVLAHAGEEESDHAQELTEGNDHGDVVADDAGHADPAHAGGGSTSGWIWFHDLTNPGHSHFHGFGGTATGNIAITFALALIAIFVVILSAIKNLGLGGFLHHLTLDAPVALWPLTIMLEIIGLIAKPFALMVRLFANMTAGHVMLASLLGFTTMAWNGIVVPTTTGEFSGVGFAGFIPIAIASVAFATVIGVLELLVAFIQAFVFAFLTTMFISMFLPHEHHDHEHGHDDHAVPAAA